MIVVRHTLPSQDCFIIRSKMESKHLRKLLSHHDENNHPSIFFIIKVYRKHHMIVVKVIRAGGLYIHIHVEN